VGSEEKKMPFNLFHKKKQPEQEIPAVTPQEETKQETPPAPMELQQEPVATVKEKTEEPAVIAQEQPFIATNEETTAPVQEAVSPPIEQKQETAPSAEPKIEAPIVPSKTYLKAMPLRELSDLENIKNEIKNGNIIILRVTPLASKSIEDVKTAVNDLYQFADSIGGDIARLGEERVVICPKTIRIWREKSPAPVSSEPLPTSA
jgi:SepF-like predicted cell division protein (DUF552 family)